MEGWIKLHRKILEWEWYTDTNAKILFLHCLLRANLSDTNWRGISILRGQFFTSTISLSNELNISVKEIRNALKKLEKTGELTLFGASNGTMITVCKFDDYQVLENTKGKRGASEGQARGKRGATVEEEEEEREGKEEKELRKPTFDFIDPSFDFFYEWLDYKRERKESYKTEKSIKAAYEKLIKLSKGDPVIARQILEDSYASNYAGFFELKHNNQKTQINEQGVSPTQQSILRQLEQAEREFRANNG